MKKDFSKIKLFAMDVDGTLTDGKIYIDESNVYEYSLYESDGISVINNSNDIEDYEMYELNNLLMEIKRNNISCNYGGVFDYRYDDKIYRCYSFDSCSHRCISLYSVEESVVDISCFFSILRCSSVNI